MWRKGNPCALLVDCKLVELLWKMGWRVLKKFTVELLCDPAIPPLDIYPKKRNTLIQCSIIYKNPNKEAT